MSDQTPHPTGSADAPGPIARALASLMCGRDLPDALPADPMPILLEWFEDARRSGRYDDFNAMTLATATPDGAPSARVVLCKAIEPHPTALVFFTNFLSRKGRELHANPRAAAVFHWPHAKRQVRIEGAISRVSSAESDAYFASRSLLSRIGAIASRQSQPLSSRADLIAAALRAAQDAATHATLPRPDHWGGYRLSISALELWSAGDGRLHDRILWMRALQPNATAWTSTRLSP